MTVIKIEAVTDLLCPWCYVGKKNLERAIAQYRAIDPSAEFEVVWKPFYLSPALKSTGYDKRTIYKTYLTALSGDFATQLTRVTSAFADAGISLNIAGSMGNSRQAHKLLALALRRNGPAAQNRLLETLDDARAALDDDRTGKAVDEDVLEAKRAGITGVPTFTVQGRWRVGGNQEPDVFLRVFEKVDEA
ncbi:hypothetical protein CH35J_008121 [Colletotrichum higginsianum]|uniref:DSBA-like thioredoxin domain-containing protein n=1 Tax=Colletotrichum higginsianum TaxID=80884 RepID=A0A4V4NB96_9PEZI|nr:hypothetical protein CH35J_008121 [Colletotrichum higginsianum]